MSPLNVRVRRSRGRKLLFGDSENVKIKLKANKYEWKHNISFDLIIKRLEFEKKMLSAFIIIMTNYKNNKNVNGASLVQQKPRLIESIETSKRFRVDPRLDFTAVGICDAELASRLMSYLLRVRVLVTTEMCQSQCLLSRTADC